MQVRRLTLKTVSMLVAALPAFALLAFYAFVAAWRLWLGYWPRYGDPDAGALHGAPIVSDIGVFVLLIVGLASALAAAPAGVASIASARCRWPRKPVALWAVAWGILVLLIWADPGAFFDWDMD